MNRSRTPKFSKPLLAAILTFCLPTIALTANSKRVMTLVGLTDFHGQLLPQILPTANEIPIAVGGAAYLQSYIDILKQNVPNPILVDAGDVMQGSMESNYWEGAAAIEVYKKFGVLASAIGNHDFDYGPVGPKAVPTATSEDPVGALLARMEQGRRDFSPETGRLGDELPENEQFHFLSANITSLDGMRPSWAVPFRVYTSEDGTKIGIIGLSTQLTPATTMLANVRHLQFVDPVQPTIHWAHYLREEENVDFIILTMHEAPDEVEKIICAVEGQLPGAIDAAVAGHTHRLFSKKVNCDGAISGDGIPLLQPAARGSHLQWAQLEKDGRTRSSGEIKSTAICGQTVARDSKDIVCSKSGIVAFDGKRARTPEFFGVKIRADDSIFNDNLPSDPKSILGYYVSEVAALKAQATNVSVEAEFKRNFMEDNAHGNFTADLMREYFNQNFASDQASRVSIAMTNNGGIRTNFQPTQNITYGDVFDAFPFDNMLAVIEIKGKELKKWVEVGQGRKFGGYSWSGLQYCMDGKIPRISVDGKTLSDRTTYRILTTEFVAGGGDGFSTVGVEDNAVTILHELPNIRDFYFDGLKFLHSGKSLNPSNYFDPELPRSGADCSRY